MKSFETMQCIVKSAFNKKFLYSWDIIGTCAPLSGRMIWFNFRHHQQKLCHFTPWSISFHVRYVSKKSVCPKGVKIEAEKRWVVKEWEFWKTEQILLYQFFNWFNFAFMVCSQFPTRNGLKLEFVLFKAEPDNDTGGISNPTELWLSQLQKGQILFLGHF